jgi:hypothetical protein
MKPRRPFYSERTKWRGRDAYVLGNRIVRLITLTGGGHIAAFQLENTDGSRCINPLWTPPWKSLEPYRYREKTHKRYYGPITEGKLLSGVAGHNICLDYFGLPSADEAKQGLSLHGEAPSAKWRKVRTSQDARTLVLAMSVHLPAAGLTLQRDIELRKDEAVVYFTETVTNERKSDHFFHWTQHVTLGPQFLVPAESSIALPGTRALTDPHGYDEGRALLESNKEFRWPGAPLLKGGTVDLSRSFIERGLGFVVAVLLTKERDVGFVAAINRKLGLVIAYCFRRSDFPWVAIWEENLGIAAPPWKQRTRARGLEFSTTPLPVSRHEAFLSGQVFDEPTMTHVPAMGAKTVQYVALLTKVSTKFGNVRDIRLETTAIHIVGDAGPPVVVRSSALGRLRGDN